MAYPSASRSIEMGLGVARRSLLSHRVFHVLVAASLAFAAGMLADHRMKEGAYGVPGHKVSGNSMSPTFKSGDQLVIRPLREGERVQVGWIVSFAHQGERNVKRVKALPGQIWEGRIVPDGHVAVWGDCREATDPNLPLIPASDIRGVVTGVRYAEFWESPEGLRQLPVKTEVVVPPPQPIRTFHGVKIARLDANSSSLTDIGIAGDVRQYYRVGSVIAEESTAAIYEVTGVGLDTSVPHGMTRLTTRPDFSSWTNAGRVALLAPGQSPPEDVVALFRAITQ